MFGRRLRAAPPPPPPPSPSRRPGFLTRSMARSPVSTMPETPPKPVAAPQPAAAPIAGQGRAEAQAKMSAGKLSRDDLMNMQQAGQLSAQDMDRMQQEMDARRGGFKSGGKVSSASKRADGIAQRGKTKGRYL